MAEARNLRDANKIVSSFLNNVRMIAGGDNLAPPRKEWLRNLGAEFRKQILAAKNKDEGRRAFNALKDNLATIKRS
ncbi:MAG: hypothetical protein ABID38_00590 [Candidatus Diapherotrites archaeon]